MIWMRVRHGARLVGDVWWMSRVNRMWWIVPVLLIAFAAAALGGAAKAALPYAVYTLF